MGRTAVLLAFALVGLTACSDDDAPDGADPVIAPASTTTGPSTTTEPSTTTTTTAPVFAAEVLVVTADDLHASWRPGCPHPLEQLRAIEASHWGYDGEPHVGRVVVDAARAEEVVAILRELWDARFPIEKMEPIDVYGGSDELSTAANNTSAFNCRRATGGTSWSEHAYGRAIDVNPAVNPYVRDGVVLPPDSGPYLDRTRTDPGLIHDGDAAVEAFARQGWIWGGHWTTLKDYQHFSPSGR
jgi:hypothetical protein